MTTLLRRAGHWGARAAVLLVVGALMVLTVAQRSAGEGWWWLELTRYLPYYWLAVPCIAALLVSLALGRWWIAVAATNLALLAFVTMGFVWSAGDAADQASIRLRLMTFNVKAEKAKERPDGLATLASEVAWYAPDLLVMQDADGLRVARSDPAQGDGPPLFGLPYVHAVGQYVIASRFPLYDCTTGQIGFRNESHRYLRCRVDIGGRAVSVVTAHFQSPRSGLMAARHEGLEGADEWLGNYQDRLTQARALATGLADLPRPLVVAGDLNAPDTSPVVGTLLATGLRDTFSSAGRGWGYTYGHNLGRGLAFLRIDHILVSPDIGVVGSSVGTGAASDHRPVIADLFLRPSASRQ